MNPHDPTLLYAGITLIAGNSVFIAMTLWLWFNDHDDDDHLYGGY